MDSIFRICAEDYIYNQGLKIIKERIFLNLWSQLLNKYYSGNTNNHFKNKSRSDDQEMCYYSIIISYLNQT